MLSHFILALSLLTTFIECRPESEYRTNKPDPILEDEEVFKIQHQKVTHSRGPKVLYSKMALGKSGQIIPTFVFWENWGHHNMLLRLSDL